jgi:hypothetical protein
VTVHIDGGGAVLHSGDTLVAVVYDEIHHDFSPASTAAGSNWWGSAVVPTGTVDPAPVSGEVRFFANFGYDLSLQPES